MGQENLTEKEQKMLNIYLREADRYLGHLKIHDKATLLLKMETFLIELATKNEKDLRKILDEYGHVKSFVDYHLVESGFKKSARSFSWKYLILFFLIFVLSLIIGSFVLFKKIRNAITDNGINIEMNNFDKDHSVFGDLKKEKFHFEGTRPEVDYKDIKLVISNAKIDLTSGREFSYDCYSENSQSIDNNFSVTNNTFNITLEDVDCHLVLPINMSFIFEGAASTIQWKVMNKKDYHFVAKTERSSIVGQTNEFSTTKTKLTAEFVLKECSLNIK